MKAKDKKCINGHTVRLLCRKCPECGTNDFRPICNTCDNCGEKFPVVVVLEGNKMRGDNRKYCYSCSPPRSNVKYDLMYPELTERTCSSCKELKPIDDYVKERISITGRQLYSTTCKKCKSDYSVWYTRQSKQNMVNYKGGVCEFCGYNDCLIALDFHHMDPTQKEFSLKERTAHKVTEEVKKELDKCILLCATCHREEHDRINSEHRDLSRFDKETQ